MTVRFDIIWRTAAGASTVLATATNTFEPLPPPNQYDAVPFETDVGAIAADAVAGDHLVLRFNVVAGGSYIPNGDGSLAGGRIPNLTLP